MRWLAFVFVLGCAGPGLPRSAPLGSGQARLHRDGDVLHVEMAVQHRGIGSLLVQAGDRLWVLHASAALGTGIYRRDGDHWRRVQDFTFECRDDADTACRDAFRARDGWIANAAQGGADRRFELDLPRFGAARIAVTYLILDPAAVASWPPDLDDDAVSLELQQGMLPETIRVNLDRWAPIAR